MIIAIDPGSNSVGYAIMTDMDTLILSGTIKAKASLSFYERLEHIASDLLAIMNNYECNVLAIEDQYVGINPRTALKIGKAAGYLVHAIGLPVVEIAPSTAKAYVTGNGSASKDLVRSCVIARFEALQGIVVGFDEADAIAVGVAYFAENR